MTTLIDFLIDSVHKYKNNPLMRIRDEDNTYREYTYQDFYNNTFKISRYLFSMFKHGKEKIAILSENRPEWGMTYFGILMSNNIAVPLDAMFVEKEIIYTLNRSGARVLFCSQSQFEKVNEIINMLSKIKKIILFDKFDINDDKKFGFLHDIYTNDFEKENIYETKLSENDIASLIFTSGTTGTSKGVLLTHKNFLSNVLSVIKIIKFDANDVFLSVLPLHHTFEFTSTLLCPISIGSSITYAESLKSKKLIQNIKDTNITVLCAVPLLFEKMYQGINRKLKQKFIGIRLLFNILMKLSQRKIKKTNSVEIGKKLFASTLKKSGLYSLRIMISGAAPMDPAIADFYRGLGFNFLQGYGLTECSPIVSVNPIEKCNNKSVGIIIDDLEIKIDNPDNKGIGEILVKGNSVMMGYYMDKETTEKTIENGWLHTGDQGYLDSDGYLYISGRSKNIIVTPGGKNIYPEEIEYKLNRSPFILESLVLGKPVAAGKKGEEVVSIIVPDIEYFEHLKYVSKKRFDINPDTIKKRIEKEIKKINNDLVPYKKIKDFSIREDEFTKTSTRKIKRYLYKNN